MTLVVGTVERDGGVLLSGGSRRLVFFFWFAVFRGFLPKSPECVFNNIIINKHLLAHKIAPEVGLVE